LLRLMRDGKTPSDVAEIMGFQRRQRARENMSRVVVVVRFYCRHARAIRRLYGASLPVDRRTLVAFRMYVVGRMGQREIAERLGYGHRRNLCVAMLRARRKMAAAGGCSDVLAMLKDCSRRGGGSKVLRMKRRRLMADEAWRDDLKRMVMDELVGRVWYEWGAQSPFTGKADCSGLALEVLKAVGVLPKGYPDRPAQGLAREFRTTVAKPKPGDLAFYGASWQRITHVMFYVGDVDGQSDQVAGMCGGRVNMKADRAFRVGAGLWVRPMRYRRDFLGCRRVG